MTALTIGFFDGVHIGHQALLRELRKKPHAIILTFSNHPQSVFTKKPEPQLLLTLPQKIALLKQYADEVIVLPFTLEFAETPFDALLSQYPLTHLILGTGSVFGKNREGNEANVRSYAKKHNFFVEYIGKVILDGEPVSSSRIRKALANNDLSLAKRLLGRNPT